jgi:hypothetical protein
MAWDKQTRTTAKQEAEPIIYCAVARGLLDSYGDAVANGRNPAAQIRKVRNPCLLPTASADVRGVLFFFS